jgi:hypothetical protein
MARGKKYVVPETIYQRTFEITVGNRTILPGDLIKINGEYGGRFKFHSLVLNKETGAEWIDCFEVQKGVASSWRSFKSDRIKLIPIKRGRRNVNRG